MLRNRKHLQRRPSRSLMHHHAIFFFFKFCIKIRLQKCQPQPSTAGSQLDLFSTLVNPDFTHLDQDLQVMPKPANPNPTSSTSRLPLSQKHMSAVSGLLTLKAPGEQNLKFSLYCPLSPTPDGIIFVSAEVFNNAKVSIEQFVVLNKH